MLKQMHPLDGHQIDFLEVFCPPRLAPEIESWGYTAYLSIDLEGGWDLMKQNVRTYTMQLIRDKKPAVVHVAPPCTTFSKTVFSNMGRMCPIKWEIRRCEGEELLKAAMDIRWLLPFREICLYIHTTTSTCISICSQPCCFTARLPEQAVDLQASAS